MDLPIIDHLHPTLLDHHHRLGSLGSRRLRFLARFVGFPNFLLHVGDSFEWSWIL